MSFNPNYGMKGGARVVDERYKMETFKQRKKLIRVIWKEPDRGLIWKEPDRGLIWKEPDRGHLERT